MAAPSRDTTHPPLDVVAAGLLRLGGDAKGPRLFSSLPSGAGVVELAGALALQGEAATNAVALARRRAALAIDRGRALGFNVLSAGDETYPAWLSKIVDPPIVLWTRGAVGCLDRPGVAIVGSRRPSATGVHFAERLARDLARAGLVVTSGLATGIDAAAHRGALSAGGPTIAVLGTGLDISYPRAHEGLAAAVASQGCVVSEFPPGMPPRPEHFPLRNRIISGLSRVVVVVEAAERSGSLITARMALEQGRGVAAVPGSVVSGCHKGCHALIKDGARLVETVADVLEELGWRSEFQPGHSDKLLCNNGLIGDVRLGEAVTVDGLTSRTGLSGSRVLAELAELELAGRVRRLPGGFFVRLD